MKKLVSLLLSILFLAGLASASLSISQPLKVYNLGDKIDVKSVVKPIGAANSFFDLNLVCSQDKNFYRVPLTLSDAEEKTIEASLLLTKELGLGSCRIKASYNSEEITSQEFRISDKLDVILFSEKIQAEAGKNIIIEGEASRENAKKINGWVEAGSENSKSSGLVNNGNFSLAFSFPENTKSKDYLVEVRVYEKYQEETTNQGIASLPVFIKQTPKSLKINLEKQSITPGDSLNFKASILDQAGEVISSSINLNIYNPKNKLWTQKFVDSDKDYLLQFSTNETSGSWRIKVLAFNLSEEFNFYLAELEKAKFSFEDGKLTITNIGNIPYKKQVAISIGDYNEIKNINLDYGDQISFKLNAPDGDYQIKISDGIENLETSGFLTGKTIGIGSINSSFRYTIAWIFIVLVLGLFIINIMRKSFKKNDVVPEKSIEKPKAEKGVIRLSSMNNTNEAEHALVMDGRKETSSLLVVNIKNAKEAEKSGLIKDIHNLITSGKASVYYANNFMVGIFASPVTRTFSNEILAVRTADKIDRLLKEHNSRARDKIDYGIGINSGELIVRKSDKLRFTSIGNALSLPKKIAELSNSEILLSESINNKIAGEIKSVRKSLEGINVYALKSLADREKYGKFVSDFLNRQK